MNGQEHMTHGTFNLNDCRKRISDSASPLLFKGFTISSTIITMVLIKIKTKLTIVLMLLIGCSFTNAAIITVDNQCTLANALIASSKNMKSGDCKAGSGIDTIVLPSNGHYVIPIRDNSNIDFDHIEIESIPSICKSTVIIQSCPS